MNKQVKYKIVELVYEGMVTKSYKAIDEELNRHVLLKKLNPHFATDSQWLRRFEREAKIQASLKHRNIVTIYELGKGEDFYIVSEFVQGKTLGQLLIENGPFNMDEIVPLIQQIVDALRYAHEKGVVHRDLKPANIMISDAGEVKLTDFGLAFAHDYGSITQEGMVVGTPAYMSPEQARAQKVDYRSDIFSLGITVYESLSGQNPFKGDSHADSLSLILHKTPEPLDAVAPQVPKEVANIVRKMLRKDPSERLSRLDELVRVFSGYPREKKSERVVLKMVLRTVVIAVLLGALFVLYDSFRQKTLRPHTGAQTLRYSVSLSTNTIESQYTSDSVKTDTSVAFDTSFLPVEKPVYDVRFMVTPWAHVFVDGESLGVTPLGEDARLSKGKHTVTLKNPYYPVISEVIDVTKSCSFVYNLDACCAFLNIKVEPWGVVTIDAAYVDTTPLERPIPVLLGEHTVKAQHPVFGHQTKKIKTDSSRVYTLIFNLEGE